MGKGLVEKSSSRAYTAIMLTEEMISAQKKTFAIEWLKAKTDDPTALFRIACDIEPVDVGRALAIAKNWPTDAEVLAFRQKFLDEKGEEGLLPTKSDAAMLAWEMANDTGIEAKDRLKALELYGSMLGFVSKPVASVSNNQTNVINRVMIVKDTGTNEQWERKVIEQQRSLKELASARGK